MACSLIGLSLGFWATGYNAAEPNRQEAYPLLQLLTEAVILKTRTRRGKTSHWSKLPRLVSSENIQTNSHTEIKIRSKQLGSIVRFYHESKILLLDFHAKSLIYNRWCSFRDWSFFVNGATPTWSVSTELFNIFQEKTYPSTVSNAKSQTHKNSSCLLSLEKGLLLGL